ncbi:hypothetical protein [Hymenobacter sp. YC55]|uniref:hypothetical protein n=1 Tax=Hymenobacter sp. YC55 TaxID=3034019 RepID=UPI0023FA0F96|nr:hypothetical protein [Hymenobacter sp. YC55]MDF7810766.1 hypothetical protein [Hymenobacter sp. YC55]
MACILTFELPYNQKEIRHDLMHISGFLDAFRGFLTTDGATEIETALPHNVLFHPEYTQEEAMSSIRAKAAPYGVSIDDARVVAFDVHGKDLTGWRGVISGYPNQSNHDSDSDQDN